MRQTGGLYCNEKGFTKSWGTVETGLKMKIRISFISLFIFCLIGKIEAFQVKPDVLPGTKLLTWNGDISVKMLDGAHKFIERKIEESIVNRSKFWNRNFDSKE